MTIIFLYNLMQTHYRMLLKKLCGEEWKKEGQPGVWGSVFFFEVLLAFSGIDLAYDLCVELF